MSMTRFPKIKASLYDECLTHICAEGHTPQIAVYTAHPGFEGPRSYESPQGLTIFNLGGKALASYNVNEEGVFFGAKFSGVHNDVFVPWGALVSIFAKEDTTMCQDFSFDIDKSNEVQSPPVKEEPKVKLVHSTDKPKPSGSIRKPFRPKLVE
jgi:stringent starvation protein B